MIRDFATGFDWWVFSRPSDQIVIDIEGTDSFQELLFSAMTSRNTVRFPFNAEDSLTLRSTQFTDLDADMFSFV
ncbi:hypothetical protein [Roseobacter weihaiensis]|uniref:hypothetical protein n=1 Tax=Roseobacter weihaiensis TaxID=2763262 RepID=UPI001D09ADDD|nr:hypothetical protein [Roseobacter sp. H9]